MTQPPENWGPMPLPPPQPPENRDYDLACDFWLLINRSWEHGEPAKARRQQIEAFITDVTEAICEYVRGVGDSRNNGGWSWS